MIEGGDYINIKTKDLTNREFGRLKVLYRTEDKITPSGRHLPMWHCICKCNKEKDILGWHLTSGKIQSCGCLQKEIAKNVNTKRNKYDLSGKYGVGYFNNSDKFFIFDIEDFDVISKYTWYLSNNGYVISSTYKGDGTGGDLIHRVIMGLSNTDERCVDHINHNPLDNRKENLRVCTIQNNNCNQKLSSRNTSNTTGVDYIQNLSKWRARIHANGEEIHLGVFDSFDDAVRARKEAENEYFGEYSYDNSMKIAENNRVESFKRDGCALF